MATEKNSWSGRVWTIRICAVCGSDNIETSTESDSMCDDCGEWVNCELVKVVPQEDYKRLQRNLGALGDSG